MGRPKGEYVNRGTHSLNEDRANVTGQMRSKATVKRLKMYRNSKERRNAIGKIVKDAPFQSTLPSGKMARIEPNRKWFGNTRVISEKDLMKFQEYENTYDPFQVTLRRTVMPLSLNLHKVKKNKPDFKTLQPYFKRKITVKESNIKARTFEELSSQTKSALEVFNAKQEILEIDPDKDEATHGVFRAGTSSRIWQEVYKVIDSSDVLLYVLDARNPLGMRSAKIELDIRNKQKKIIFVLNKVDLVPSGVTRHWERELNKEYPTILFYADMKHPLGKNRLIALLRQFRDKMKDRRQISVGIIGFPNTGKSSLINALKGEKVCKVAPIAGETKVWQYISLMKSIDLIDCPGTVTSEKDEKLSETDLILRNSVRVEKVEDADRHIPAVLKIVNREVIDKLYKITQPWSTSEQFLEMVAKSRGRLLKGAQPDIMTVSKEILKDFNSGKLVWYVKPGSYDNSKETMKDFDNKNWLKQQVVIEEAELAALEEEQKLAKQKMLENNSTEEDGEKMEDSDDEEEFEDITDERETKTTKKKKQQTGGVKENEADVVDKQKGEFDAGIAVKPPKMKKQMPKEKVVKKMTSKERRKLERASKDKKVGIHFYKEVDVKMKRTKYYK